MIGIVLCIVAIGGEILPQRTKKSRHNGRGNPVPTSNGTWYVTTDKETPPQRTGKPRPYKQWNMACHNGQGNPASTDGETPSLQVLW